jgi:hypothetical protein
LKTEGNALASTAVISIAAFCFVLAAIPLIIGVKEVESESLR